MAFGDVLIDGRRRTKNLYLILSAIVAFLLLLPMLGLGNWGLHMFIMVMLYSTLAAAWNFLGGYTGQFSVGHSAFFGVAGYAMGIAMARNLSGPVGGAVLGVGLSLVLAFVVGISTMRLRGIFFSLTTFALAEILRKLALFHDGLTGGPLGLSLVIPGTTKLTYYYIALGLLASVFTVNMLFERSRFGMFCMSIRENEDAAMSAGINTSKQKVAVALLSAFFTGLCGTLYAAYIGVIEPDVVFSFNLSIKIIILAIIGGVGTIIGPFLGALVIVVPEELIRGSLGGVYAGVSGMAYGLILIITLMLKPAGLRELFIFMLPQKKD
jgi:branched-chain amino acid transport system permease protein